MSIKERVRDHVVIHAIKKAANHDEFRLSLLVNLLPNQEYDEAMARIISGMGASGVLAASIYFENADIGNGTQTVGRERVLVRRRKSGPTGAEPRRMLSYSTIGYIASTDDESANSA